MKPCVACGERLPRFKRDVPLQNDSATFLWCSEVCARRDDPGRKLSDDVRPMCTDCGEKYPVLYPVL